MLRHAIMRLIRLFLAIAISTASVAPLFAQTPLFDVPHAGVSFVTGDTWAQNGQMFRLYGVQSCLRGTMFTNQAGTKADCGEASLAYFAALVRDTRPQCAAVGQIGQAPPTILVVCSAHVGAATLDMGTILITEGFSFAAFGADAKPVYMPYLVAELLAKNNKAGLWAARDLPHPNPILFDALQAQK
jgi:endonuclease YncB( thermonuclease family)